MRHSSLACRLLVLCFTTTVALAAPQQSDESEQVRLILRQASALVEPIPDAYRSNLASHLANLQAVAGDIPGAIETVRRLKKPQAFGEALASVALVVDANGNLEGALTLIDGALTGQAKARWYQTLASTHAIRGDFEGGLKIAHRIEGDPNALGQALINIAKEQGKAGDREAARHTFDEAVAVAERAGRDEPFMLAAIGSVAAAQADVGETSAAAGTLNYYSTLIDKTKDSATRENVLLPNLAMGLAQIGDTARALSIANSLPPGSDRDITLEIIAARVQQKGDVRDALQTISRISDPQMKATAIGGVAVTQGSAEENVVAAIETANSIPDMAARATALSTIALQQAERGDDGAWRSEQLAWEAAKAAGSTLRPEILGTIAVTRALLGDFAGAEEIVNGLSPETRSWPLEHIATIEANSGNAAGALALAERQTDALSKASALVGTADGIRYRIRSRKETTPRQ